MTIERKRFGRWLLYATLLAFAGYYLFPLWVMVVTSFKTLDDIRGGNLLALPQTWTLAPWKEAWSSACTGVTCDGMRGYFFNSLKMVIPAVLISTFLGSLNGYALTKWKFKGSDLFFGALLLGCFIPFQLVILPMARLLGEIGWANSLQGLVLVHIIYGLAFTTLFSRNYYVGISNDMINAARVDGAGFFGIYFRILLPISVPILMVTIIWQFTQIWNDFLFGVVFSSGEAAPITVALNNLVNVSTGVKAYNVHMAAAIYAAMPTLFVYVVAGKYFLRGLTAGSVKG